MAENYNLNSAFGLNISTRNAKNAQAQKSAINDAPKNMFSSIFNYVDEYENVLNGDVAKEIGMYSRQAMFVGMNLKASDNTIRKFDVNI